MTPLYRAYMARQMQRHSYLVPPKKPRTVAGRIRSTTFKALDTTLGIGKRLRMIEAEELARCRSYDWVVRLRPDVAYTCRLPTIEEWPPFRRASARAPNAHLPQSYPARVASRVRLKLYADDGVLGRHRHTVREVIRRLQAAHLARTLFLQLGTPFDTQ